MTAALTSEVPRGGTTSGDPVGGVKAIGAVEDGIFGWQHEEASEAVQHSVAR